MRFTETDIEVLTKDRTKEEGYKVLELTEIDKAGTIPKFQHEIKWRKRSDLPTRWKTSPARGKVCPPSLRQSELQRRRSSSSSERQHPAKRQNAVGPAVQMIGGDNEYI